MRWSDVLRAARFTWLAMALVPASSGPGCIRFSQLDLQRRLNRSSPRYDPAAERILPLLSADVTPEAAARSY